ncbi:MAG: Riboflavin transporter [Chloroflexi bacterium ADurb.Bin325]|nr:MAG: Riboflavin transporter [Chloroflexi bacterium ADurb.Bin325]
MTRGGSNIKGIGFLILGMLIISLQSVAVKGLGGSYPVLEMVVLRNVVALPFTLLFFRYEGRRGLPTTKRFGLEFARGLFLFLSYTTFMMGLAALPLAEVESIRLSGPIMITLMSVFLLRERVELGRWLALFVGLLGVLLIVRPGSATFNIGSIFVLVSVFLYALIAITTRKLQATDSSATMAFYSSLVYLAAAILLVPLTMAVGELPAAHPSIAFLFRGWTMPTLLDGLIMGGLGLVWAGWTYFMARAYSITRASVLAPFEYLALPINAMWGFVIWREIPTWLTLAGAALTLASGLFILSLDRRPRQAASD